MHKKKKSTSPYAHHSQITVQLNAKGSKLASTLHVRYVTGVHCEPDQLTIFNHPSNVVTLRLADGSDHYQAYIETLLCPVGADKTHPILKISQISAHGLVVSPIATNGLANLLIYDFCVPPAVPILLEATSTTVSTIAWMPSASAKIHVAGINSILVNYEDDKLQVGASLRVYVQISDATGKLIKTSYFALMNLRVKCTDTDGGDQQLATVEPESSDSAPSSSTGARQLSDEEREYTVVYVVNGVREGVASLVFEGTYIYQCPKLRFEIFLRPNQYKCSSYP